VYITNETTVCLNLLIDRFAGNRKTLRIMNKSTLKNVMFLQKYKDFFFGGGHTILTEGVFVTQLPMNVGISI